MIHFDDLSLKPKLERLLVRINQLDDKIINTWKLTDLLSSFGSSYYKTDLLHSVITALNNDIRPEDIILFEKSINYKVNDYNFSLLELDNHTFEIYKLGLPVSIFPNRNIFELRLLFKVYKEVSSTLHEFEKTRLLYNNSVFFGMHKISEFYQSLSDVGFEITVSNIVSNALNQIPQVAFVYKETIRRYELNTLEEYRSFYNERKQIKNISKNIKSRNDTNLDKYERFFLSFFKSFEKIDRPIVAIYNSESQDFNFLCNYHFNPQEGNPLLMIIDKISHNSPYEIIVQVADWIIATILSKWKNKIKPKEGETEEHLLKLKTFEEEEKRLQKLYFKLDELYIKNITKEIQKLNSIFLSSQLEHLLDITAENFKNILDEYKFDIVNIEKD